MQNKIKKWFKGTSFHYWIVLVVWPSIKIVLPFSEIKGKIMEILISLIASFFLLSAFGIAFQIQGLGINLLTFLSWLVLTFLLRFFGSILYLPAKLHRQEKKKADRYNWNDVNISYEYFDDKAGYKIKLENNKAEACYFLVELQYLEVDGVRKDYDVPGKSRMLLWIPNPNHNIATRDSNWTFGFSLTPNDRGGSENIGFFELSNIAEDAHGIKNRIVFCDWHESDTKRPLRKYADFTRCSQGELKIHGTYHESSIRSSQYDTTNFLPKNLVYRFRINIINNQQIMKKFEVGSLEHYADSTKEDATK
jgi:hypothetical protein